MRAWRFHQPGDIANLVLEEVECPEPASGEALVEIYCAALNPADRYLVQGQYPRAGSPPFTPGRDAAGVVVKAAPGGRFKEGDSVFLLGGLTGISKPGALAEYCPIPEEWLAPVPEGWTFEQAAAAPLVHLTAWRALVVCGGLQAGETVLITGASGGVGSAAVTLAHALGAHVVALSRSAEKRKALAALGADLTLDTTSATLEKDVRDETAESPVSLVVETLGGDYLKKCIKIIASHGRIMVLGLLADMTANIPVALLIHKNLRLQGMSVSAFSAEEAQEAWQRIMQCYSSHARRPLISRTFGFDQVQEAFAHLQAGPLGKVVVHVRK